MLTSRSPDGEIHIDAQVTDWSGALSPVDGEQFTLGVLNDKDNLYVALISHDQPVIRQIIMRGLTFWFDPDGGSEKTIGLRFPMGFLGEDGPRMRANSAAGPERMKRAFERSTSHLEIVQGEDVWRYPAGGLPNVGVHAALEYGTLTLELRIPLGSNRHFDLGAPIGNTLGLGLETPPLNLNDLGTDFDEGARSGRRGGGFGNNGGGFGGGRDGFRGAPEGGRQRPGRDQSIAPDQLKFWTIVTLAR